MAKKRISLLASLTRGYKRLVDIGCDHGYTIKLALEENFVEYAYALEINEKPLEKAKETLKNASLLGKVSFFISNGLKDVNPSFDVAIISGMGGQLITSIISDSIDKFKGKTLILEPQSDNHLVRALLAQKGFKIEAEYNLVENNKYYEVMVAKPGEANYSWYDLKYGPILRQEKNEYFMAHYQKLLKVKRQALKNSVKINKNLAFEIMELEYLLGERKMEKYLYDEANYYNNLFLDEEKRDLVIIFPGGGYNHTSEREAENVAEKFNALGYHAIVFHYREKKDYYPEIYLKIANEIRRIATDKRVKSLYLHGYSAGGHLALELALHSETYDLPAFKGLILAYPVVSACQGVLHEGSFKNLLGNNDSETLRTRLSEELEVTDKAPNMFIWTTATDKSVPALNSLLLVEAYQKYNLSYEFHIFPMGNHGLSLATKETARDESDIIPYVADWFSMLEKWLKLQSN